jgi:hypothetical protein
MSNKRYNYSNSISNSRGIQNPFQNKNSNQKQYKNNFNNTNVKTFSIQNNDRDFPELEIVITSSLQNQKHNQKHNQKQSQKQSQNQKQIDNADDTAISSTRHLNYKDVAKWKENPSEINDIELNPGWLKIYYKDGEIKKEYTSEYNRTYTNNSNNYSEDNSEFKIHVNKMIHNLTINWNQYKEKYNSVWGEGEYERMYGSYPQTSKENNSDISDNDGSEEMDECSEDEI